MAPYIVLECPVCNERRLQSAAEASKDRLIEAVAAHLLQRHPETPPAEAEALIERAIDGTEVTEYDSPPVAPGSWSALEP